MPNTHLLNLKKRSLIVSVEPLAIHQDENFKAASKKDKNLFNNWLSYVNVYKIVYKVGKLKVAGYIALPKKGRNLPCIIHLRGGSRDFGALTPWMVLMQMVQYAVEGYVVIGTQYPGGPDSDGEDTWGGPANLESIKKLKTILENIPTADTSRIGMKGHSRGGLMAYMILPEVQWLRASVISGAPTDQFRQGKERKGWREHQISLWGKSKSETLKRSPLYWPNKLPKDVPLLIMHGSADWRVNPLDSIEMCSKLYEYSIPHRYILFEGADHGITEYRSEFHRQSLAWFERFLKNREPLPNLQPHGH